MEMEPDRLGCVPDSTEGFACEAGRGAMLPPGRMEEVEGMEGEEWWDEVVAVEVTALRRSSPLERACSPKDILVGDPTPKAAAAAPPIEPPIGPLAPRPPVDGRGWFECVGLSESVLGTKDDLNWPSMFRRTDQSSSVHLQLAVRTSS